MGNSSSGAKDVEEVEPELAPEVGLIEDIPTEPFEGQKPGTSGLRKKTQVFMQPHYLENFVQSTFDAVTEVGIDITSGSLLIGGDGRYHNDTAIQTIISMAAANGVKRIWIGRNGLLSTPAASAIIRERGPRWQAPFGAFILTASHNPGGPDEDFGIKFNCKNGEPAPEFLTDKIYLNTTRIIGYKVVKDVPTIDLAQVGTVVHGPVTIEVIDSTDVHVNLLKSVFDFTPIKDLLDRPDFSMLYDSMHGVNGPYAIAVFENELGQHSSVNFNAVPKEDFNGAHADPNLTYAEELVAVMGLDAQGGITDGIEGYPIPSFGAAADGDGDRNMILGSQFFVTPSDSLAVICDNAECIPFIASQGGLKGVARSMPTSGAVDHVAKKLGIPLFETPTGWKYFGNLMDSKEIFNSTDYTPFICGEESFGTGSNHIREKDGIWAVLAWLQILAFHNPDPSQQLVTVEDIVQNHWKTYGRNYYCRWDFEGVDKNEANRMMAHMRLHVGRNTGQKMGSYVIATADDFEYVDPVDESVTEKQGIRFLMEDGSRIIFRLSGTAGSGATVRMYIEKYEPDESKLNMPVSEALNELVYVALDLSDIKGFCGTETPTVIT